MQGRNHAANSHSFPLFFVQPLYAATFSAHWVEGEGRGRVSSVRTVIPLEGLHLGVTPSELWGFHKLLCIASKLLPFDLRAYCKKNVTITRLGCSTTRQVINWTINNKKSTTKGLLWIFLYTQWSAPSWHFWVIVFSYIVVILWYHHLRILSYPSIKLGRKMGRQTKILKTLTWVLVRLECTTESYLAVFLYPFCLCWLWNSDNPILKRIMLPITKICSF